MNREFLAEKLYDAACVQQHKRMNPKEEPNPRKVGCEFKDLWPAPKEQYLAMADWVLNNFLVNK